MINYKEEIKIIVKNGMTPEDYAGKVTEATIGWARARAATASTMIAQLDVKYNAAQKAFEKDEKADKILQNLVKRKFAPRECHGNINDVSKTVEDLRSKLVIKLEDTR